MICYWKKGGLPKNYIFCSSKKSAIFLFSSDATNLCPDAEKCRINTNVHMCSINVGLE